MTFEPVFQLTDQIVTYMQQIFKCHLGIGDLDTVVRPIHLPVDLILDCELMARRVAQAYRTRGTFNDVVWRIFTGY